MDDVAESAAQSERDTCYWGELTGGLAAPTTWPLQSGQALDVYYSGSNDPKDGIYDPGYYRGIILVPLLLCVGVVRGFELPCPLGPAYCPSQAADLCPNLAASQANTKRR